MSYKSQIIQQVSEISFLKFFMDNLSLSFFGVDVHFLEPLLSPFSELVNRIKDNPFLLFDNISLILLHGIEYFLLVFCPHFFFKLLEFFLHFPLLALGDLILHIKIINFLVFVSHVRSQRASCLMDPTKHVNNSFVVPLIPFMDFLNHFSSRSRTLCSRLSLCRFNIRLIFHCCPYNKITQLSQSDTIITLGIISLITNADQIRNKTVISIVSAKRPSYFDESMRKFKSFISKKELKPLFKTLALIRAQQKRYRLQADDDQRQKIA